MVVSRENGVLDSKSKSNLLPAQLAPTLRNFLSTLVWRRWRRWTLPVQAWLFHAITHDPNSPPKPYRTESLPNLNAAVGLSLLETLDENIDARRARVRAYRELLGGETRLTLIPHRPGSPCLTRSFASCRGTPAMIYPPISSERWAALATKCKGVMCRFICCPIPKHGYGSVFPVRNESGAI
jgi:hypothetical protein